MPFNDNKEGQTNFCTHTEDNSVCDKCLGIDKMKDEIIRLLPKQKIYLWDNGECTICGFNEEYNEGVEHECAVHNSLIKHIYTIIPEIIKVVEKHNNMNPQDFVDAIKDDKEAIRAWALKEVACYQELIKLLK